MKRFAALLGLALAVALPTARAQQNPDDQYLAIYNQMQQADTLQASGQPRQALAGYTQALAGLQKFQKMFPYWDPEIIAYRLSYLADKVNGLAAQFPAVPQSATATNAAVNPAPPAASAVPAATPATDAEAQLNALRAQVQNLQADNETLQAKLKEALRAQPATVDTQELAKAQAQILSLMKENDLLRASLATGATTGAAPGELVKVRQALADANKKLAEQTRHADKLARENQTLQSDAKINGLEKTALEARLRQRQTPAASAPTETSDEVKTLRARLAVDEAQPVPFTPEELALLKSPAPSPAPAASPSDQKKPISELPGGSAALAAEAQNYFSAGDYDKAGADYLQILQRDPNNALALANLATIELHENKLEDAGKHAQAALAQSPNDAFNLAILGKVELAQGKLDAAFDVLSRAAKSDPQNPEMENYLGATLAQKGLRAQAETAFRKAIELDPNYGDAHNNLAVVYLGEKPPMAALARWHYQKALDLGQPRNPDLEKTLADLGAPVSQ
jgi:tetratricopeptide (TPR) repeat protein